MHFVVILLENCLKSCNPACFLSCSICTFLFQILIFNTYALNEFNKNKAEFICISEKMGES